jgi:hypothetical protein
MAAPIITLQDSTHATLVSDWHVGTVKAGNPSDVLEVNVWNNKGGATEVSDMRDGTVTCKDGNGENTGDVPVGKWMNVLVDATAELDGSSQKVYSAIGGDQSRPLRGQTVLAATGDVIKGTVNDGVAANSGDNYSNCKFKVVVPINANPGNHQFKLRFQGYYV